MNRARNSNVFRRTERPVALTSAHVQPDTNTYIGVTVMQVI